MLTKKIMPVLLLFLFTFSTHAKANWPVATPDTATMRGSLATIDVLQNDTGQSLKISQVNAWTQKGNKARISTILGEQEITFYPQNGFTGTDTFWYAIVDSQGRTNSAKVTVEVQPGDFWPIAEPDSATVKSGQSVVIPVLANDDAIGGKFLVSWNKWSVNGGSISLGSNENTLSYKAKAGFIGEDSFWYVFKDGRSRTNAAKVTVTVTKSDNVVEGPYPTAKPDFGESTSPRVANLFKVLENDIGNGLRITYSNPNSLKGGQVSVVNSQNDGVNNNSFIVYYSPVVTEPTTDKIWYTIEDNQGRTNFGVVTISIR